jgi:acyl transferase domain-containing protein
MSNGSGIVLLKRFSPAYEDGDEIHALIKGSAINNDGNRKVGYTAPSVKGQLEVIKAAHQMAEVKVDSIGYIETHGNGTHLGDPVELEALKLALETGKKGICGIGSIKTNMGHLDSAAGIASFIKTTLALKHRLIPPSLHFETPNPKIHLENSPFFINCQTGEWKNNSFPLRAGVSSFGIGGTNAHVILEEAPKRRRSSSSRKYQLLLLSAKTESALNRNRKNLANYLKENPGTNLADAAYTLQVGRRSFKHRNMLVYPTHGLDEAVDTLISPGNGNIRSSMIKASKNRPVIFMFPGQGAQYVDMGLELYQEEEGFRSEMDRCFKILANLTEEDIKGILYPGISLSKVSDRDAPEDTGVSNLINRTAITQPLIFAFEYALAKQLMKWGIKPYAMIGHSIGEYTTACLAGVFSLEDALKIVALRGRLMQQMPGGSRSWNSPWISQDPLSRVSRAKPYTWKSIPNKPRA